MYEDRCAALLILSKDQKNIAIIMENQGSGFEVVATNDAIIPDWVTVDERWWISTNGGGSQPAFHLVFAREPRPNILL